ncbi:riboflavin synthase [Croceimicrobium sp.]|uniref:riboflavin synthase n=1 Tax=Croceimicrobium sp. TaxID=2828340 RepID=UPI003BACF54D
MFTGIIESLGTLVASRREGSNLHFDFSCDFTSELKIDQSLAHNGVCLTVVAINGDEYTVTAIDETLQRTNLGQLQKGDQVNLERCMQANGRYDGHIVQGHVDTIAECEQVLEKDGSWEFHFKHAPGKQHLTVEKGSVTINGVSLTVVRSEPEHFSVAIIPYTYEHTNFKDLKVGSLVNIEFDILGKYVARMLGDRA